MFSFNAISRHLSVAGFLATVFVMLLAPSMNALTAAPSAVLAQATLTPRDIPTTVDTSSIAATIPTLPKDTGAAQGTATTNPNEGATNNSDSIGCTTGAIDMCLSGLVYYIAVAIPSFFLYVANIILSIVVKISLTSTTYAVSFIATAWTVCRDIANMAFLFILIYLAFVIMLKAETHGTTQTLATVIVIALLVNFSFFATRVVVDAGNILAVQVYNAIPTNGLAAPLQGSQEAAAGNSIFGAKGTKDLSGGIMNGLNVQGLLGTSNFTKWNKDNNGSFSLSRLITLSCLYIAIGIIAIILAFAFLTAAGQFFGRIVYLWFAIIVSPLALVSYAIPGGKKYFDRWSSSLIKNSIYPSVFLFVLLILTLFMNALGAGSGGNVLAGVFEGFSNTSSDFLTSLGITVAKLAIELGFVIAMIKLALDASNKIGLESAGMAEKASGWMGGQFFGATGWAGRQTLGFASNAAAESRWMKNAAGKSVFGRALQSGLRAGGKANFDYRSAPGFGTAVGVDAGKAQEGGYKKMTADRQKSAIEFAHSLAPTAVQREKNLADAYNEAPDALAKKDRELIEKKAAEMQEHKTTSNNLAVTIDTTQKNLAKIQEDINVHQEAVAAAEAKEKSSLSISDITKAREDKTRAQASLAASTDAAGKIRAELESVKKQKEAADQSYENAAAPIAAIHNETDEERAKRVNKEAEGIAKHKNEAAEHALAGYTEVTRTGEKVTHHGQLDSRNWKNLWKLPHAGFITTGEAAAKLRADGGKSDIQKALKALEDKMKGGGDHGDDHGAKPAAHAPAPKPAAAAPAAPAADPGGGHGPAH